MTTKTDAASAIDLTSATLYLSRLSDTANLLNVTFKSENHWPTGVLLKLFRSRSSLTPASLVEVSSSRIGYSGTTHESSFSMTWGALRNYVQEPILRVQLRFEGLESNIQNCDVNFPGVASSVTVGQSEEITVSWVLEETGAPFNYAPPLYFLEELSTEKNIQRQSAQIFKTFGGVANSMVITPDAAIKKAEVFQCKNTLAYGNPSEYPVGNNDTYVLKKEWSAPVSIIGKPVTITSVSCGKAANGKFTLEVKWQNSSLSLGVKLVIRSDAVPPRQEACQPGASSFTFTDLELDPHKAYTVAAFYYKDPAVGPESEPIPILQVPVEFNLNYYEKGSQINLEARWQKQAPPDCVYRVVVSKDGVAGNAVDTNSDSLVLGSDTANSGQRITATIRAAKGISTGPVSDPVPAPFVSESAFAFDDLGRLREVAADKKQKTTFAYDERGNITAVQ